MKLYNEKFISTEDFKKYLVSKGLLLSHIIPGVANIWRSDKREDYEILQPINTDLKDFSNRVKDLINVLCKMENKTTSEIIKEIDNISNDVISLRVIHDDVANGEIPFSDGVLLFQKTKELMLSAARSVIKPQRAKYLGKNPELVERFFNSLKLGQTEVGSYVLNLIAPIYWEENQQEDHCKVPFSRTVTERLINSIDKLNNAIIRYEENGDIKIFETIVKDGVNATLCSALIGLSGCNKSRSVEIKVMESQISEVGNMKINRVLITQDKIKYIEDAERFYANDYTIDNYSLIGSVTRLNRDVNSLVGVITIVEPSENNRKVTVELDNEHYEQAIKAHENKYENVHLIGKLLVTPRQTKLIEVHDFQILHQQIK
ncbi:hypothetical protein ABF229_000949 [Yersinia ruckeri]